NSGTTLPLSGVSFVDATRGWVAGGDGTILAFTDVKPTVDLAISATGPASASSAPGSQVPVNVHIVNNGPNPSTQGTIVVTTTLPPGVILASGTGGGFGCTANGQAVTCTRTAPLAPGATADLALVLTVTDPNLTAAVLTFQVIDPGANDPNTANNATTITISLRPAGSGGTSANNPFANAGGFFGFNPDDIVRQCLASCSVENNRQESSQTVTQAGAPQTERERARAERDADRAADRGEAKADSGALAASGTRAQAAAASAPASTSRIPFTGANTRHQLFLGLLTLVVGWLLASMAPRKQVRRFLHSRR
ncbi:MAG: hypothetical protein QOD57_3472, partial [Actinomycetota bacterium]|nr:hypothetical protein [Actinomycetota bacterium]